MSGIDTTDLVIDADSLNGYADNIRDTISSNAENQNVNIRFDYKIDIRGYSYMQKVAYDEVSIRKKTDACLSKDAQNIKNMVKTLEELDSDLACQIGGSDEL